MKLQVGDVIDVHGWVMLEKMEGRLKVAKISNWPGVGPVYGFKKPRGRKVVVIHPVSRVDFWVSSDENPDSNKIVRIGK